jgi:hypothetical protein
MNITTEFEKISAIDGCGKFVYRGVVYTLDEEETRKNPINANLGGKPLKKLTGSDDAGNTVIVWTHDCEAYVPVVVPVVAPAHVYEEDEDEEVPMPVVKTKKPKGKKKSK